MGTSGKNHAIGHAVSRSTACSGSRRQKGIIAHQSLALRNTLNSDHLPRCVFF
ncbi:hypothetical protein DIQ79_18160 [Mycolicibacterium smegmatis]|uniref:Uncharacterized protein n=1 Tax=Mycolicibacterium smegmatis (strain ATCC 700084 / mc(2)155) TaxID=246196 RepID=A0R4W2_MYCS2|nr:hypothetical protein MSMEG_5974 [Mycolicibacterium smegmatis MC2 155]TBM49780.1 hypothetical protein DIQ85_18165 [Mycolicibacterium smegmatis]TBH39770.1 hypothetical protein EYS45_16790 [Mycolicibacterium smegmatis MC2 155]TBM50479.1 hypothetical protein DIQ86_07690 [Mycolicibacterium smegmatis]TBM60208.1 hypothetical protein DIQ83_18225 [Mycolicibacterium smegmatis]